MAQRVKQILLVAMAIVLASCSDYTYENTGGGKLAGEIIIVSVGPDRFVYVPGTNRLSFTPSKGKTVTPGMMYTNGSSIPAAVRALESFSAWGYAPAYVLHDWLFQQRYCAPEKLADLGVDFEASARILAQIVHQLTETRQVARNDRTFEAISWASATPFANRLWNSPKTCAITPEDLERVKRALPKEFGLETEAKANPARKNPQSETRNDLPAAQIIFRRRY